MKHACRSNSGMEVCEIVHEATQRELGSLVAPSKSVQLLESEWLEVGSLRLAPDGS